jgi:hypothetical protein
MPLDCWAVELGDCDGQQSGEHIVSGGIWTGPTVDVIGFPWCKDSPKKIGIGALTANILCRRHNSLLSPLDSAAKEAFKGLATASQLANGRRRILTRPWTPIIIHTNGTLLERWCLKTALNIAYIKRPRLNWGISPGLPSDRVPLELVRAAFGHDPIRRPMGLYALAAVEAPIKLSEEVHIATLLTGPNFLAGVHIRFYGLQFFLYMMQEALGPTLPLVGEDVIEWGDRQLLYHLQEVRCNIGAFFSHRVDFVW